MRAPRLPSLVALVLGCASAVFSAPAAPPNLIFILADDLGYGELGCYGQEKIRTPRLDRFAAEGLRFTQFYAGSTVCAPSRSVLMTGLHLGHTRVRGNAGGRDLGAQSLQPGDVTVPQVLRAAGYATGLVGKWGLGEVDQPGEPRRQGFDTYFGYLSQTHAHNHYPSFLWRDGVRVALPNDLVQVGPVEGAGYSRNRVAYGGDLLASEALAFVERHRDRPFFLFWSLVTPHANNERARELGEGNEVPDQGPYAGLDWPESARHHAAMVTRMDRDVGALLDRLAALGLDERTLVLFSSDNGPHREGGPGYDPAFFRPAGPFSGLKRSLTDGGIRVPFLARWPGRIPAGRVSAHPGYFGDLFATWAELAGARAPAGLDSLSLVPTLLGRGLQARHPYLYWEFYEQGVSQAALFDGRWKVLRLRALDAPLQVFDLATDPAESRDLAADRPDLVARARALFRDGRADNEHWRLADAAPAPRAKAK